MQNSKQKVMNQKPVNNASALSFLPYMPFNPAWVEQSQAFSHKDPCVAKASLCLLFAAWRGNPAGSIPSSHAFIASCTGQSQQFVVEHFDVLTEGFVYTDNNRLQHYALANICSQMTAMHGPQIEAYALAAAMAVQDPEMFSLTSTEASSKKPRGKTLVPKNFSYEAHPELRAWVEERDYIGEIEQQEIMDAFIDFSKSRTGMYKDWPATFRNYVRNAEKFNPRPPRQAAARMHDAHIEDGSVKVNPFARLKRLGAPISKGDQAAAQNSLMLDRAAASLGARSGMSA